MHRLARWFMAGLALLPLALLALVLTGSLRARLGPVISILLAMFALICIHHVLTRAEARGWIYYRKKRGSYGGLGVTSDWLNIYDPSRRHVQEATRIQEWQRDEDDDGAGDDPAGGTGRSTGAGRR